MKGEHKLSLWILLAAFILGGCGNRDSTLKISSQVHLVNTKTDEFTLSQEELESIKNNLGGTGKIEKGMLSFTIGKPDKLIPFEDGGINEAGTIPFVERPELFSSEAFDNISIKPGGVLAAGLNLEGLGKWKASFTPFVEQSRVAVFYVYVDRDCTITADGKTFDMYGFLPTTSSGLDLKLNAGWNAITEHNIANWSNTWINTLNYTVGDDPSCKWGIWHEF
jgi:hypothetical protein